MPGKILQFPKKGSGSPDEPPPPTKPETFSVSEILNAAKYYLIVRDDFDTTRTLIRFLLNTGLQKFVQVPPDLVAVMRGYNHKELRVAELNGRV